MVLAPGLHVRVDRIGRFEGVHPCWRGHRGCPDAVGVQLAADERCVLKQAAERRMLLHGPQRVLLRVVQLTQLDLDAWIGFGLIAIGLIITDGRVLAKIVGAKRVST